MKQDHPRSHPSWSYAVWAITDAASRPAGIMIQVTDRTRTAQLRQQTAEMTQEMMLSAVRQHELLEAEEQLNARLQVEIDERKRAEAALRETTGMLEELVAACPVGITILDPEGKVILWNPAMETISGWREAEVRGKLPPAVEAGQEGAAEELERLLSGERLEGVELRRVRKDGRPVDLLIWTAPIREERGQLKNTVVISLDITPLKEMEQMALAQQKLATLGQVAAGIAHEVRNPLSGLNLYVGNLEKILGEADIPIPDIRAKTKTALAGIISASARMETITARVLSFSRPGPPRRELFDINERIHAAVGLVKILLQEAGTRVVVALQKDLPLCRGDMRLFEQVLINLITNAAQAMEGQKSKRVIELTSSVVRSNPEEDPYVAVSVADSGPGIPEEARDRIFEPFVTTRKQGVGIGLFIAHKIISDHRGFIRVGTSRFGGALFTIGLPIGDGGKIRPPVIRPSNRGSV